MATASVLIQPKGPPRLVGHVYETLTVSNRADQILARKGVIAPLDVRTLVLEGVLVDTGATSICLPADLVAELGLDLLRTVLVSTAAGDIEARVFDDLRLSILGREGTFECLELPGGSRPLLGVVPMEMLGLEPDLKNHRLRLLPDDRPGTYLLAMLAAM